eukprot:4673767-Pyramimonas_sp.AAC.1
MNQGTSGWPRAGRSSERSSSRISGRAPRPPPPPERRARGMDPRPSTEAVRAARALARAVREGGGPETADTILTSKKIQAENKAVLTSQCSQGQ